MGKNKAKKGGAGDAKAAVSLIRPAGPAHERWLTRLNGTASAGESGQEAEAGEQARQDGHEADQEEEGSVSFVETTGMENLVVG